MRPIAREQGSRDLLRQGNGGRCVGEEGEGWAFVVRQVLCINLVANFYVLNSIATRGASGRSGPM